MDLPTLQDELRDLMEDGALDPETRARMGAQLRVLRAADAPEGAPGEPTHASTPPEGEPLPLPPRYRFIAPIGRGGMGEVYRVWDAHLDRAVALKVLRRARLPSEALERAFLTEAKATAQLQHPGIVPVHEVGILPDGRPYFTMKEVTGRTLALVIDEAHRGGDPLTFRRLITTFQRVAATVAFAHAQGVIHRDLKPSNVMVGAFGEVMVMDWGLAIYRDAIGGEAEDAGPDAEGSAPPGKVRGTPAYMAPEQASGGAGAEAPAVDVYALGAILYEILTGHPPYPGRDPRAVLAQVRLGAPAPLARGRRTTGGPTLDTTGDPFPEADRPRSGTLPGDADIPPALRSLCEWAIQRDPGARPASAAHITAELQAWLDGARRRESGLAVIARADGLLPEVAQAEAEVEALRGEAQARLDALQGAGPEGERFEAWALQDRARALEGERDLKEVTYLQLLRGALTHDPELPEAHARLAAYYRRRHGESEGAGEIRSAANLELLLRSHDRRGDHRAYLKGEGALTLVTDPPGALARLHRFEEVHRYLTPGEPVLLGETPIIERPLPMGSYLLTLERPGFETVSYPVYIPRLLHWDGVRPGGSAPHPIPLPPLGALGEDEIFVPPGPFWSGGDRETLNALPRRRLWIDGVILGRYPVTVAAYLRFLNALIEAGRDREALRWAPREGGGDRGEDLPPIFPRDPDGRFTLGVDALGIAWQPDWPAVLIDWPCARAFARFEAERTGRPYRLPWELEWEKAARGVDGRTFPWGETFSPAWACIHSSHGAQPTLPAITQFPRDKSPYGMLGAAGGVRDWCQDSFTKGGYGLTPGGLFDPRGLIEPALVPLRVNRGGGWLGPERFARTAFRYGYSPAARYASLGMRLARSYP